MNGLLIQVVHIIYVLIRTGFPLINVLEGGVVLMGNDDKCKVVGKGSIQSNMQDGVIRTLSEMRHVPDLKSMISLGTLEDHRCKYAGKNGVMKISKGA